jgi:GrpB-like predicted nucleotidyltransferase (UPF0157 family)
MLDRVDSWRALSARLHAAGVAPDVEPLEAWRRLRAVEGSAVTILDLYELEAHRRGLAATDLPAADRHALARSAMPEIWPGWAVTPGSTRGGDVITVVDYDPRWPDRFAEWSGVVKRALGSTAVRVEHVGSTSVPGLAAKPVVDVQVSVRDLADEAAYVPQLEAVGLQLRSRDVFHRYFRPFAGRPRDVHVHVCEVGSEWEADHLLFRDHLRTDPEARDHYARAKREAAALWSDDGIAYTEAKTAVVLHHLEEARRERDRRG